MWRIPVCVYEWDLDHYHLARVMDIVPKDQWPSQWVLGRCELKWNLDAMPFLVLRKNGTETVLAPNGAKYGSLGKCPRSRLFHVEHGMMMLHLTSPMATYRTNPTSGRLMFHAESCILSDVQCFPMRLNVDEVRYLMTNRLRSIRKQLRDQRLVVEAAGRVTAYKVDTWHPKRMTSCGATS